MSFENALPSKCDFEIPVCPECGSKDNTPFIEAEDDLGGRSGRFFFVTCTECGLVYQSPRLNLDAIKPYYDDEYIAHRKKSSWGILTPFYDWAMGKLDREKIKIVRKHIDLNKETCVLDIGCGSGSFLAAVQSRFGSNCTGVDFKDLSHLPWMANVDFRLGTLSEQDFGDQKFDLITMWHFLEHDYEPAETLSRARELLAPGGCIVIEVPRLDSLSFRMFKDRWPGLQAPQHTVLLDGKHFRSLVGSAGLKVKHHLSYGAFPAYFYFFLGVAFRFLKGKGLNFNTVIYPYFAGQILTFPIFLFEQHLNFAMQTIIADADDE